MPQYVLLLRDGPQFIAGLGAEEVQRIVQKYGEWRRSLAKQITGGHKLKDGEGRVLQKHNGKPSMTDGPYAEAKEVMAGLFILEADSYEQAVELAKTCPHMEYGSIEVRVIERSS